MESSKIGYWLQVGANIGILGGLILVLLQMNQNAELLRIQLLKQEGEAYVASEMVIAGENFASTWVRVHENPFEPDLVDMRIMESSLWGLGVYKWINAYKLYELGHLSEEDWKRAIDESLSFAFGNPYARGWWDAFVERFSETIPPDVLAYADQQIKALPVNATNEWFAAVRHHVAKYRSE